MSGFDMLEKDLLVLVSEVKKKWPGVRDVS